MTGDGALAIQAGPERPWDHQIFSMNCAWLESRLPVSYVQRFHDYLHQWFWDLWEGLHSGMVRSVIFPGCAASRPGRGSELRLAVGKGACQAWRHLDESQGEVARRGYVQDIQDRIGCLQYQFGDRVRVGRISREDATPSDWVVFGANADNVDGEVGQVIEGSSPQARCLQTWSPGMIGLITSPSAGLPPLLSEAMFDPVKAATYTDRRSQGRGAVSVSDGRSTEGRLRPAPPYQGGTVQATACWEIHLLLCKAVKRRLDEDKTGWGLSASVLEEAVEIIAGVTMNLLTSRSGSESGVPDSNIRAAVALGVEVHGVVQGYMHREAVLFSRVVFRRVEESRTLDQFLSDCLTIGDWLEAARVYWERFSPETSDMDDGWASFRPSPGFCHQAILCCRVESRELRRLGVAFKASRTSAERGLEAVKQRLLSLKHAQTVEMARRRMQPATLEGDDPHHYFLPGQWRAHCERGQDNSWWVKQIALYARSAARGEGVVTFKPDGRGDPLYMFVPAGDTVAATKLRLGELLDVMDLEREVASPVSGSTRAGLLSFSMPDDRRRSLGDDEILSQLMAERGFRMLHVTGGGCRGGMDRPFVGADGIPAVVRSARESLLLNRLGPLDQQMRERGGQWSGTSRAWRQLLPIDEVNLVTWLEGRPSRIG